MPRPLLTAARLSSLLQTIYPRQLAGSWDNTGLLLESAFTRTSSTTPARILLCIDITTSVCDEALKLEGCAHIVSYHPIIFSGIKALTLSNSQQRSLLRLAAAGISVYSPHSAVDAVKGGVNDMLVDCFAPHGVAKSHAVEPSKVSVQGFEGAGLGRIVQLEKSATLDGCVESIKAKLGLRHLQLAKSSKPRQKDGSVMSVAICAGSGGSVLKGTDVDLILTGELSHHEQLAFVESGTHVILCGHSDTERPYLPSMKSKLETLLKQEHEEDVEVVISEADKSPFETI